MPANLNNVTTSDAYTAAATVVYMGTNGIALAIANAAVYAEFDGSEDGRGVWSGETFFPPTMGWYPRKCSGIRFRSALAGKPAQVSCQLFTDDESSGTGFLSPFTQQVSSTGAITTPSGDMIKGDVAADGTAISGAGFQVTRLGGGRYKIDFVPPLANQPVLLAIANGDNTRVPSAYNRSAASASVHFAFVGGPDDDVPFSFIATVP